MEQEQTTSYGPVKKYLSRNPIQPNEDDLLGIGLEFENKWVVEEVIGRGTFGQVYKIRDLKTEKKAAIKINNDNQHELRYETNVLKDIKGSHHFTDYICHKFGKYYNYIVMELNGPDLYNLQFCYGRFFLSTTLSISLKMFEAIEELHKLGYIHRDIKNTNFTIGAPPNRMRDIILIDFNMAKKYMTPEDIHIAAEDNVSFLAHTNYSRPFAHMDKTMDRRDDLWALLFCTIECRMVLPWANTTDLDEISKMKEEWTHDLIQNSLTPEISFLKEHIEELQYSQTPNYDFIRGCYLFGMKRYDITGEEPYEWEMFPERIWDIVTLAALDSLSSDESLSSGPSITRKSRITFAPDDLDNNAVPIRQSLQLDNKNKWPQKLNLKGFHSKRKENESDKKSKASKTNVHRESSNMKIIHAPRVSVPKLQSVHAEYKHLTLPSDVEKEKITAVGKSDVLSSERKLRVTPSEYKYPESLSNLIKPTIRKSRIQVDKRLNRTATTSKLQVINRNIAASKVQITDKKAAASRLQVTDPTVTTSKLQVLDRSATQSKLQVLDRTATKSKLQVLDRTATKSKLQVLDPTATQSKLQLKANPSMKSIRGGENYDMSYLNDDRYKRQDIICERDSENPRTKQYQYVEKNKKNMSLSNIHTEPLSPGEQAQEIVLSPEVRKRQIKTVKPTRQKAAIFKSELEDLSMPKARSPDRPGAPIRKEKQVNIKTQTIETGTQSKVKVIETQEKATTKKAPTRQSVQGPKIDSNEPNNQSNITDVDRVKMPTGQVVKGSKDSTATLKKPTVPAGQNVQKPKGNTGVSTKPTGRTCQPSSNTKGGAIKGTNTKGGPNKPAPKAQTAQKRPGGRK